MHYFKLLCPFHIAESFLMFYNQIQFKHHTYVKLQMVHLGEELIAQFFLMKAYALVAKVWFTQLATHFSCCTFITVLSTWESTSPTNRTGPSISQAPLSLSPLGRRLKAPC